MSAPQPPAGSRAEFLQRSGLLAVVRSSGAAVDATPELFIAILDDGRILAFNSHVDLGTGIRTALAQIVAEELDVDIAQVEMILGDSEWTPLQGPTVASETIQVTAVPLRCAAAQARATLIDLAADRFGVDRAALASAGGEIVSAQHDTRIRFGDLIKGKRVVVELDPATPTKSRKDYRLVGTSTPRVDIPAKAAGEPSFVHDIRLPGMLHGRVIRPPYAGRDSGSFVGRCLRGVDESSIAHISGIIGIVIIHDFVGVVADREEQAEAAARALKIDWGPFSELPDLNNPTQAIRDQPRTTRKLIDQGDTDEALLAASKRLNRTYHWPYQIHGSIGPSCSVAAFEDGRLRLWSGTQAPLMLRADLAMLLDLPQEDIEIIRVEASGSYGRNGADDVGADAALLARAVGRPVRVQLTREQENLWDPKGTAQLMEIDGGIDADGQPVAYDFQSSYPSDLGPNLALLLTRKMDPSTVSGDYGDRTVIPLYHYPNMRIAVHDMLPIARAAYLRGVSALPNVFAHESYIDELAMEVGADPVAYRVAQMEDPRAIALAQAVTEKANWVPHTQARLQRVMPNDGTIVRGQGFAQAVYVHGPWPGTAAAWAAWVAEVEVDTVSGEVTVTRVIAGQDSGLIINPAGVRHQIHGNVIQSTSRALLEQASFDERSATAGEWGSYPILPFPKVPAIDVVMIPQPDQPPLGVGESASVPSAAAIANAVFDATGVRFREMPLTPERVRAGLAAARGERPGLAPPSKQGAAAAKPRPKRWRQALPALGGVMLAATALLWPFKPVIAPISRPAPDAYSVETIERGRQMAEAGDCAVCHTTAEGPTNAGGRAIETPFGTVYSTNITPDPETGIGSWSYPAFERAMREGISRDGHHLYPAFPYTAYTRMNDADLQALYAYLMASPAVRSRNPVTKLAFPFNLRPMLAAWNAMFLSPGALPVEPSRSAEWNRGAYLVEAVGHCSACHSPRNMLGAEMTGASKFAGGLADGWEAPPLGAHANGPIPWDVNQLYDYLRRGSADLHGPAAGPMVPVIAGLRALPDHDVKAMAVYLASLGRPGPKNDGLEAMAQKLVDASEGNRKPLDTPQARLFEGACAVCHARGGPDLFGRKWPLALNANVYGDRPDNLIRIILDGSVAIDPAHGAMPAFRHSLNDRQIADLVGYVRETFAPAKSAWPDLEAQVARVRAHAVQADGHGFPR